MDIDHFDAPVWYHAAITLNVVFPVLVVLLSGWIRDARIAVAVPILGSTVASSYGLIVLLASVERTGAGWPTRAAGVATALVPVALGAALSAISSGVVSSGMAKSFAARRTRRGTLLLLLAACGCFASFVLCSAILLGTPPSLHVLKMMALASFALSGLVLIISTAAAVAANRRARRRQHRGVGLRCLPRCRLWPRSLHGGLLGG